MLPYLFSRCGNPGSAHSLGRRPRAAVAKARAAVAALVGAEGPEDIVFCGPGTEAINWALREGVRAGWRRRLAEQRQQQQGGEDGESGGGRWRPHVVTTAVEHPAVLALLRHMEAEGEIDLDVVRAGGRQQNLRHRNAHAHYADGSHRPPPLPNPPPPPKPNPTQHQLGVCSEGLLRLPELAAAFRPETALVAVMHANNEVGALQPIAEVAALCRARGALLFVDAAQSVGKVPVDVQGALGGPDMVSIVGHKFGGPKGVAALYIRRGLELGAWPMCMCVWGGGLSPPSTS